MCDVCQINDWFGYMYVEGVCAGNNNNNNHYWSVTFTISYTENQLNRHCSYILDDMYEHVYASLSSNSGVHGTKPTTRNGMVLYFRRIYH